MSGSYNHVARPGEHRASYLKEAFYTYDNSIIIKLLVYDPVSYTMSVVISM